MRILVVTNLYPPEFLGGYELGCAQMTERLRTRGHDVLVATGGGPGGSEEGVHRVLEMSPIYDRDPGDGVNQELWDRLAISASAVDPSNLRALAAIIDRFAPDVCYLWNIHRLGGFGILHLLRQQGLGWVWHLMDSIPLQMAAFGGPGREIAKRFSTVFPGRFVACSAHVVGEIEGGGVELGEQVWLVPNWIQGARPARRRQFFRGGSLRMVSSCGTLSEEKGTHLLIQAAARLRDAGYANFGLDLYGRIAGDRFRSMILEHGVPDLVHLRGSRPHAELLQRYGEYDLFVFPTWNREPSAFAPLEAAAAGCVPLISAGCGNAEWMIDGVDCLKAPRDADRFARQIERVLCGEIDLEAIGRRAQSVAWRDFHISRALARVEPLLEEAASERCPPRGPSSEACDLARFAEGLVRVLAAER